MFPISDDNEPLAFPILTILLILACVAAFALQLRGGEAQFLYGFELYGFQPAELLAGAPLVPADGPPAWATVFTSMFMHGDLLHLLGNIWFLWIFGDNVEGALGRGRFLIFYALCGVAAALTQAYIDPYSQIPMVGASGAISGVLGAYLLLYPLATVRTLLILVVFVRILHVPAVLVLGLWFLFQLLSGAGSLGQEGGGVAFFAHIGGFIAGMVLVPFMKGRRAPLFGPARTSAFAVTSFGGGRRRR